MTFSFACGRRHTAPTYGRHRIHRSRACGQASKGGVGRRAAASRALLAGESVDEVAFLLGHRDGTVTRTVYVREVADARRRALRRSRMTAEYAGALRLALDDDSV